MIHSMERYIEMGLKTANDIHLEIEKSSQESYPLEPILFLRNIFVVFEPSSVACCWLSCDEVSRKPQLVSHKISSAIPFARRIKSSLWSRAHSRAFLGALIAVLNVSAPDFKHQEPHTMV